MRASLLSLIAICAALSGCVDPKHSRFANQGACEVSLGSRICSTDPGDSKALTSAGDPSLQQSPGGLGAAR